MPSAYTVGRGEKTKTIEVHGWFVRYVMIKGNRNSGPRLTATAPGGFEQQWPELKTYLTKTRPERCALVCQRRCTAYTLQLTNTLKGRP